MTVPRNLKSTVWNFSKQVLILILVVSIVGVWQSRNLPNGIGPALIARTFPEAVEVDVLDRTEGHLTLVYFFAPWCGVCRLSMGNLNHLQAILPRLKVCAVGLDYDDTSQIRSFLSEVDVQVPVYLGDQVIQQSWKISAYPTYVIMDSHGKILATSVGYSTIFGMGVRSLWALIFSKFIG